MQEPHDARVTDSPHNPSQLVIAVNWHPSCLFRAQRSTWRLLMPIEVSGTGLVWGGEPEYSPGAEGDSDPNRSFPTRPLSPWGHLLAGGTSTKAVNDANLGSDAVHLPKHLR